MPLLTLLLLSPLCLNLYQPAGHLPHILLISKLHGIIEGVMGMRILANVVNPSSSVHTGRNQFLEGIG